MNLENKVVLISGGSSGVGKYLALDLCMQNCTVIILGRSKEKLMDVSISSKNKIKYYQMDLNNLDEINKVYSEIEKEYKRIDIVINSAGIGIFGELTELDQDRIIECININLTSTILLTSLVAKNMKLHKSGQIINIESIASTKGFKYGVPYVASKFGLAGFSQVIWQELKEHNIKVASVRPGLINTNFMGDAGKNYDLSSALSLEDIAHTVRCIINQSETSNISEITLRPLKKEGHNLFNDMLEDLYSNRNK